MRLLSIILFLVCTESRRNSDLLPPRGSQPCAIVAVGEVNRFYIRSVPHSYINAFLSPARSSHSFGQIQDLLISEGFRTRWSREVGPEGVCNVVRFKYGHFAAVYQKGGYYYAANLDGKNRGFRRCTLDMTQADGILEVRDPKR